jgi:hypothetical protein
VHAAVGAYSQSETVLFAEQLLPRLGPGVLLLADRRFFSYTLWRNAIGTGADLMCWVRTDPAGPKPEHVEDLPDGSWLAHLRRATPASEPNAEPVRVVDYRIDGGRENTQIYRLFTTLADPDEVSAEQVASTYTSAARSNRSSTS